MKMLKQGIQGPLKLSALKSYKILSPPLPPKKPPRKCAMKQSEMAFLSNSRWQNRKERPNRSTNNGYIAEAA